MAQNNRYRDLDRIMTAALIAAAVIFILYLVVAGVGILWAKILTAILAILLSVLCLGVLYMSKEILKQRSLWLTTGFGGILVCTLVSLFTSFP